MDCSKIMSEGKTFDSFLEFKKELKSYCNCTKFSFITAKSQKLSNKNQHDQNRPYKMKFYKCADKKCNASIRLCLKEAGFNKNKYMVTRFKAEHTHDEIKLNAVLPLASLANHNEFLEISSSHTQINPCIVTLNQPIKRRFKFVRVCIYKL